jgi:adenylate kinase
MMRYRTFLIFGAPGSGKGTQGKILGAIPRFFHCACGDVFRALDTRTELGQAFLEYSSRGQLVPDELTVKLWHARIVDVVRSHAFKPDIDSLVLDGIPRNVSQARLMEDLLDVKKVFHLSCPDRPALIARLEKAGLEGESIRRRKRRSDSAPAANLRCRIETGSRVLRFRSPKGD